VVTIEWHLEIHGGCLRSLLDLPIILPKQCKESVLCWGEVTLNLLSGRLVAVAAVAEGVCHRSLLVQRKYE